MPGAPGRVATLIPDPAGSCRGVGFLLAPDAAHEVLLDLDHREKGGYVRHALTLDFDDDSSAEAVTWIARPDNPNWLGPASVEQMAVEIARSHGPSGANSEYLLELHRALQQLGDVDPEVAELVARLGP